MEELASTAKKRKRGSYHHYSDEVRAHMGRHAAEHHNTSAVTKFTTELEHPVNESTIRNCRQLYLGRLKDMQSQELVKTLPYAAGGRSLLLGDLVGEVVDYVKSLRQAKWLVSTSIIIAGAKGIAVHRKPSLLKENGGSVVPTKDWADYFRQHHGFVKRQAAKAAANAFLFVHEMKTIATFKSSMHLLNRFTMMTHHSH